MDPHHVELLEQEIEVAIGQVFRRFAHDGTLKAPPSARLHHLMAKAAVAVYEAVADDAQS
jgi:hypothetical protein